MKKAFIFAAAAALALAACSKNDIIETINKVPEDTPIGFSTYASKSVTKADTDYYVNGTTQTTLVSGKTFGVYAWSLTNTSTTPWTDGVKFTGSGNPTFMSNIPVTFNGSTSGIEDSNSGASNVSEAGYYSSGNPVRYWPSGDTPAGLSFFAYYPANATGLERPVDGSSVETGLGDYRFTTNSSAATQIDLMVSDVVADQYYGHTNSAYQSGTRGTVDLHFHHTLTKVQFKFKTDLEDSNTTLKLQEARLSDVYNINTLTVSYASASGETSYTWGTAENKTNYDITISGYKPSDSEPVTLSTTATTLTDADAFLMVPQTIAANQQEITLTWTVTTAGHTTTNTKTFDLNDIKNGSADINWGMNQQITYIITISPKAIYFTASVDGWGSETTGTISVN